MVKLVDTRVLEARAVRRVGSSPILGTKLKGDQMWSPFLFLGPNSLQLVLAWESAQGFFELSDELAGV